MHPDNYVWDQQKMRDIRYADYPPPPRARQRRSESRRGTAGPDVLLAAIIVVLLEATVVLLEAIVGAVVVRLGTIIVLLEALVVLHRIDHVVIHNGRRAIALQHQQMCGSSASASHVLYLASSYNL